MQAPTTISRPYPKVTILSIYRNLKSLPKYFLTLCLVLFFPIAAQATCITTDSGAPYNTGTGCETLLDKTTGQANTATGFKAMQHTTTGSWNAAHGNLAL
jgi:hypothetical protein